MLKIDRKYFPSKNFLIALSVAVIVVVVSIIFVYWKPSVTKYTNDNLVADSNVSSSTINSLNIDSDNDGLPDWKENLYGTDPHNSDTDGDGTPDGQEVAENRDPLKANTAPKGQEPNDKIDPTIIADNQKIFDDYEKLNATEKLARDLVSNVIASQPVSGSMDQNSSDSILNQALSELPEKNYTGKTKLTDLNLLPTDSSNLLKNFLAYQKNFAGTAAKLVPLIGTDLDIINLYVSTASTTAKLQMTKLTKKYQAIVDELIKMPVPIITGGQITNLHLTIINDLEKIIAIDTNIVNSGNDPISIFSNISNYNNATQELFTTLTTVSNALRINFINQ